MDHITFEEYILDEGLRDALKKFNAVMTDFHSARKADLDFDVVRAKVDQYILNMRDKQMDTRDRKKVKQLKKLSQKLKAHRGHNLHDRAELGKIQDEFEPILKSLAMNIHRDK